MILSYQLITKSSCCWDISQNVTWCLPPLEVASFFRNFKILAWSYCNRRCTRLHMALISKWAKCRKIEFHVFLSWNIFVNFLLCRFPFNLQMFIYIQFKFSNLFLWDITIYAARMFYKTMILPKYYNLMTIKPRVSFID